MAIKVTPKCDRGYKLFHDGMLALSQVETNGIRIDREYLRNAISETEIKIKGLTDKLRSGKTWRAWSRRFGLEANLDSRPQLGAVLYEELGYTYDGKTTDSGRHPTDEATLESLQSNFVQAYLQLQKLQKANGTYLKGIQREVDDNGFLHPAFWLHTVETYRGSCTDPNFQNMPIRNPEMGKLIRRCVRAREGYVLVENDFKGVEVSVAACYHKDPVMLDYITNPEKDMHRDMAMQLFKLKQKQVTKAIRHAAKNKFVFPQFYGDWFKNCAKHLWEEIDRSKLEGPDGKPLFEHLAAKGFAELGDFEMTGDSATDRPKPDSFMEHVKEVENDFWNNRFKIYTQWKKDWYSEYLAKGSFQSYTGFLYQGVLKRNEVINYAVQGSAFHCLLWSLIRIQRELNRRRMKTKIVGQIHDSILADVFIPELDDYLAIVRDVTEHQIQAYWDWLIIPLSIECEISPIGTTWYDKKEVKINRADNSYSVDGFNGSARDLLKFWEGKGTV